MGHERYDTAYLTGTAIAEICIFFVAVPAAVLLLCTFAFGYCIYIFITSEGELLKRIISGTIVILTVISVTSILIFYHFTSAYQTKFNEMEYGKTSYLILDETDFPDINEVKNLKISYNGKLIKFNRIDTSYSSFENGYNSIKTYEYCFVLPKKYDKRIYKSYSKYLRRDYKIPKKNYNFNIVKWNDNKRAYVTVSSIVLKPEMTKTFYPIRLQYKDGKLIQHESNFSIFELNKGMPREKFVYGLEGFDNYR